MSNNAATADNQQGSRLLKFYGTKIKRIDPSETTRRAPLSKAVIKAYLLGALHDGTFSSNKEKFAHLENG